LAGFEATTHRIVHETGTEHADVNPGQASTISTGKGFDTCSAPSTTVMHNWLASPYRDIGIYIGGINRDCPQPELTSSWIATTRSYGWDFMPLWVGPQAPCTAYSKTISIDPTVAQTQGAVEAASAVNAATGLGLNGSVIYYDLENYSDTDATCEQRASITAAQQSTAVIAFIGAWVSGLHCAGFKAGIYGSPYTASDWAAGNADAAWLSAWNDVPSVYGLGSSGLADSPLFTPHRRIHQYWGSSTLWLFGNLRHEYRLSRPGCGRWTGGGS